LFDIENNAKRKFEGSELLANNLNDLKISTA